MRLSGSRVGLALGALVLAACGSVASLAGPAGRRSPAAPAPAPAPSSPAGRAPAAGGTATDAAGATATGGEDARVAEQLARLSQEIAELRTAVARLVGVTGQQVERIGGLERRLLGGRGPAERVTGAATEIPPPAGARAAATPAAPSGSVAPPEELYQAGVAHARAGETDAAILVLYQVVTGHPDHPLRARAQLLVADLLLAQRDHRAARVELENLLADVPEGEGTPEALLRLGVCEQALGDGAAARQSWERVVREYPGSGAAREARERLRSSGR